MPYLRIHFTGADLGRTRLSTRIDHMWELVSAVQLLQHRDGGLFFDGWRQQVCRRVRADPGLREQLATLVRIAPHAEYFPDFLTPPEEHADLGDALDAVVSVPKPRLRAEMARLDNAPSHDIVTGGAAALRALRTTMAEFHEAVIRPRLDVVEAALRTDLAPRAHRFLHEGAEAVLTGVCPDAVWEPPVLRLRYAVDRDLFLAGRGLRLVPSYFSLLHPVALANPELPPTLVFPIEPVTRLLAEERRPGDHLGALVGTTRAAILRLVVDGCGTRALIHRVGVAPATITHHTTVLRAAGLITTARDGGVACHHITPLGLRLLAGNP